MPPDHNKATRTLDAVVFDLDGVLVDSESRWDAARRAVVADAGGHWQAHATTDMMGMSASEWSVYLRDRLGVEQAPNEINRRVVQHLLGGYKDHLPLLPGAQAAVHRLAARWRLGLASSANREVIDAVLRQSALTDCFAATISADEVARGKPAPDVYLAATNALNADPTRSAAVEDSSNGLRAAAAAQMFVIAVPNREYPPTEDALALADLTVETLDQLTPEAITARLATPR